LGGRVVLAASNWAGLVRRHNCAWWGAAVRRPRSSTSASFSRRALQNPQAPCTYGVSSANGFCRKQCLWVDPGHRIAGQPLRPPAVFPAVHARFAGGLQSAVPRRRGAPKPAVGLRVCQTERLGPLHFQTRLRTKKYFAIDHVDQQRRSAVIVQSVFRIHWPHPGDVEYECNCLSDGCAAPKHSCTSFLWIFAPTSVCSSLATTERVDSALGNPQQLGIEAGGRGSARPTPSPWLRLILLPALCIPPPLAGTTTQEPQRRRKSDRFLNPETAAACDSDCRERAQRRRFFPWR